MVSNADCLPHLQMHASSDASSQAREIESGNIGSREKGISLVSPSDEFSHHWSWFKLRRSLVIALNMYYILNSHTMQGAGCTKVFLVLLLKKFVITVWRVLWQGARGVYRRSNLPELAVTPVLNPEGWLGFKHVKIGNKYQESGTHRERVRQKRAGPTSGATGRWYGRQRLDHKEAWCPIPESLDFILKTKGAIKAYEVKPLCGQIYVSERTLASAKIGLERLRSDVLRLSFFILMRWQMTRAWTLKLSIRMAGR